MEILETRLPGLVRLAPKIFRDPRGYFFESYHAKRYAEVGIECVFVQDNHSVSCRNTVRGLHFQLPSDAGPGQAKLLRCTRGRIWDVAVDIREGSPTHGQWEAHELNDENHHQLFVPIGFAHGFCVLSQEAEVQYKCSSVYDGRTEFGIAWNDPDVGVEWPVTDPLLSERDKSAVSLKKLRENPPYHWKG